MIKKLHVFVTSSLKYKLLALVLIPVMLIMIAVITMAYFWVNEVSYRQLLLKVNTDLNIAHEAFIDTQNKYLSELVLLAESYQFRASMELETTQSQENLKMRSLIESLQKEKGFDYVELINIDGCDYWDNSICNIKKGPLFEKAVKETPATGVEIFSSTELRKISPGLVAKAYLPVIRTPREHPSEVITEARGMVLLSYYPIIDLEDPDNNIKAILTGGVLLNKNFEVVDTLRDLVYSKGSLAEGGLGTVTIFLEDVRISTNVPGQLPKQRALGTRVSEEVREKVLTQGVKWVDRAFVVSEWYISAYEPIIDVYGNRVGMLYTGFLETPFRDTYFTGLTVLLLMFTVVIIFAVLLAVLGAKSIYKPIGAIARVVDNIRHGDEVRIGKLESEDELARLAKQFDDMLDKLQEQRMQIQSAADQLEIKVEDRTRQLQSQKLDLQHNINLLKQTRERLIGSEKLAAIGELTAGIAHEINNPTAVILGNMDLLIQELGSEGDIVKQETDLIIQQVYRIRSIINNLLHYSRPADYQTLWSDVNINDVIKDTMVLIHHDLDQRNIKMNFDLKATKNICGNHQQFQQVLINLIVNAIHALDTDGKITIRTRNWREEGVLMVVRDTGCGISPEIMPRIFDPFYTQTKSGTGLGLYVTSGILNHFGAEIMVRSRVGIGSSFFIWFYSELSQQLKNDVMKNII